MISYKAIFGWSIKTKGISLKVTKSGNLFLSSSHEIVHKILKSNSDVEITDSPVTSKHNPYFTASLVIKIKICICPYFISINIS